MLTTERMFGCNVVKYSASRSEWENRPLAEQDVSFSGHVCLHDTFLMTPISRLSIKRNNVTESSTKLMDKLHRFFCDSNMEESMCLSFKSAIAIFIMFNSYHTDPDRYCFSCKYKQPCCTYSLLNEEPLYIVPLQDRCIKIYFAVSENGPEAVIVGRMVS